MKRISRRDFARLGTAGIGTVALRSFAAEEMRMPPKPTGIPTMWIGAVTHDSGTVKAKLPPQAEARLLVRAPDAEPVTFCRSLLWKIRHGHAHSACTGSRR